MHVILSKELQKDRISNAPNCYYERMSVVINKDNITNYPNT